MTLPFIATLPSLNAATAFTYSITASGSFTGTLNSSIAIGVAAVGRIVLIAIGTVNSFDVNYTVTIAGGATTGGYKPFYNPSASMRRAVVDTGTTATIVATPSIGAPTANYVVIAFYGFTNTLVDSGLPYASGTVISDTVNVGNNGVVIMLSVSEYPGSPTWTGVTGVFSTNLTPYSGVTGRMDVGIYIPTVTQTGRLVQLVISGGGGGLDKAGVVTSLT